MMLLMCPWCGKRDESEFSYGGEVTTRPTDPDAVDDVAWADYLFMRSNTKGLIREWWCHGQGCRRWFTLERDTVTHRLERVPAAETPVPDETR